MAQEPYLPMITNSLVWSHKVSSSSGVPLGGTAAVFLLTNAKYQQGGPIHLTFFLFMD